MFRSVAGLIRSAEEKYKDRTAYNDLKHRISFSEAGDLSSRVACAALDMGLAGKPVLIFTSQDVYTPVLFLGFARAGCFYIPVDPSQNPNRVKQIVEAASPSLIVASDDIRSLVEDTGYKGNVISPGELFSHETGEDRLKAAEDETGPSSPMYVIYTSGSTGKPKGVLTSAGSLLNYIEAVNEVLELTPEDVLGSQSPLDYIAAIRDIYLPLLTGAMTVIIPRSTFAMANDLASVLDNNHVSVLCWSAAGLEIAYKTGLLDELATDSIRKVLFSGSPLPGRILKEWQARLPDALFINQYGPTEATASCTYYVVKEKADDSTVLPVGVPYRNYKIILLNEDGTGTPRGGMGEICVSGIGVAMGYYRNEELTAKSFVQNPLNRDSREIIYKTGDYGRINGDGLLEFHGRKDRQIKFMGHRVELEEIELCCMGVPGVDNCAAVFDAGRSLIVLYFEGSAERKEIAVYLRSNLPAFMVPGKTVKIDKIPRLPNGKPDINEVKRLAERGNC